MLTRESDEYEVTLTDADGNVVEGLEIAEYNRQSTYLYLYVKGLDYADAQRYYYVKVTHKTLGDPVKANGSNYYSDEKGEYRQIYYSKATYTTAEKRLVGIGYMDRLVLPVTLKVYRPYDTEVIYETVITESNVDAGGIYYYFTQDFMAALPDTDALYDLVWIDSEGYTTAYTGYVLGCKDGIATSWSYTIGSDTLYLNTEDENATTILVKNNKANPTFKSSDTSVVKVTVDADNKNKAVLTAVGVGIAEITVTADGITRNIPIVVERKINMEGLTFSADKLALAQDTTKYLTISALPAESWSDDLAVTIDVSGSDVSGSDVVSVEKNGNVVTVTALDRGEATIIASLTVNGETYTCECNVTVLATYTQSEQNNLAKSTDVNVLLNRFSSSTVTLKDVEIAGMDGGAWTWVDDSIKLVADDANPIQYYAAVFEKEGYESFIGQIPVRVSKLTGITVEGADTLLTATTGAYDITYKYTGYQPTETVAEIFKSYYDVAWSVTDKTSYVTVAEAEAGTGVSLTATEVTANKSQTLKAVLTVEGSTKTLSATKKITVLAEPCVDSVEVGALPKEGTKNLVPYSYNFENKIITVKAEKVSKTSNVVSFFVNPLAAWEESDTKLKWTTSDSSVATVKSDGAYVFVTVKKAGSAVLTATAQDSGKHTEEFLLFVKDYTPIVESKTLNLNLYSTEGVELAVKAQNDNTITDVVLLEKDAASSELVLSPNFTVNTVDGKYMVAVSANSTITKKTTVKPVLRITTADGNTHEQTITVKVAATKPTATLKEKTKANLFYKDAEAVYTISSKYAIASIEDVTGKTGAGFYLDEYNAEEGLVTFDTNDTLTADTLTTFTSSKTKKNAVKVQLKVTFAGYTEAAAKTITVNVATTTSKPSLKLNDITFVTGVTDGVTDVYDTKAKTTYTLSESQTITLKSDSSKTGDVLLAKVGESVAVGYDGTKTVTYKAELSDPAWTSKLTLSGKINVLKDLPLALGMSKVTLNTATSVQKNGTTAIDVAVKNYSRPVTGITVSTDKKSAALINNGYLYVGFNEATQQVTVGLNEGKRGTIKAGTYKVYLTGTFEWGGKTVTLKKTTLSIVLADKAPTVTLSAKGKIDLVQRAYTSILYTPKLTNVTAKVTEVSLGGAYAKYFEAELVDGKVEISANLYRAMSTKVSYPVEVVLTLDNGMEVSKVVKIKPISKTPKVTAELTKGTLYKTADGSFTFGLKSSVATAEIDKVVRVEDKNSKYFNFVYDEETEQITISLSEEAAKLKAGKYTISYKVYFEGAAYNVKPVTVKFTVTVK